MLGKRFREIGVGLTAYQRDLLWAVFQANEHHNHPVGTEIKAEVRQFGRTNTQGGQFYPRLSELADEGLVEKEQHPSDDRGKTYQLTEKGETVLTALFLRGADVFGLEIPRETLPTDPTTEIRRQEATQ